MKLPPYPNYKPSGIEWLGDVPEGWEVMQLSKVIVGIKDGTHGSFDRVPSSFPLLSAKNVTNTGLSLGDNESSVSEEDHLSIIKCGYPRQNDLLITIVGTIGRCCVYEERESVSFQRSVAFLRFNRTAAPKFYAYQVQSKFFQEQLQIRIKSAAQGGVYMGDLVKCPVYSPPPAEQQAIAAYLDGETGRLDRLVGRKRELIERLKEKRRALISRTVTRGLPPAAARAASLPGLSAEALAKVGNPPLKPSALDWLGDIPEHWEVKPVKYLLSAILDTEHKTCPFYDDGEFLVARTPNIRDGKLRLEGGKYTDSDGYREWTARGKPKAGDILFTREAPAGEACIVPSEPPLCIGQRVVLFRTVPRRLDSSFAIYSVYGGAARMFIEMQSLGSTVTHFNMSEIAMIPMLVPPLAEQTAIAAYLDVETGKLDALVGKVEAAVERLQEYRSALITAAVTGKIDVRGGENACAKPGLMPTQAGCK